MKYLARFIMKLCVFMGVSVWYTLIFVFWIFHMAWELKWVPFKVGTQWYMDFTYQQEKEDGFYKVGEGLRMYSIVHEWPSGYHYIFGSEPKVIDSRETKED